MLHLRYLIIVLATLALGTAAAEATIAIKSINSPYQLGPTTLQIITPDNVDPTQTYRVLYILPVEPGLQSHYGSGIQEAVKADLANIYNVICVAPTFTAMPWYANHPTDLALQQESHFIKTVLPWVEAHYPVDASPKGRLLLGFSKSGYGAVMLLLRHPDLFGKAVAWDAPVDKTRPDQFRMIDIFGTDVHFQQYAISELVKLNGDKLGNQPPRIFLMRKRDGDHPMEAARDALREHGVPHVFEYTETIPHRWDSGWLPRAAELVLSVDG